jgi:PAS domain S-box-containing protein
MKKPLRILIVEDNPDDADMILAELRRSGFDPDWHRVETEEEYLNKLAPGLEIILSDYAMPLFSGPMALEILKKSGPDIPFIVISGTIGEDVAVDMMKKGASDYLIKDRLGRLGQAVSNALEGFRLRAERKRAEKALIASEVKFRSVFEGASDGIFILKDGIFLDVNSSGLEMIGWSKEEIVGATPDKISPPSQPDGRDSRTTALEKIQAALAGTPQFFEWMLHRKDGTRFDGEISVSRFEVDNVWYLQTVVRDITGRKQAETEIQSQLDELRRWHEAMLGREGRNLELKGEINTLLAQLGLPPRYSSPTS